MRREEHLVGLRMAAARGLDVPGVDIAAHYAPWSSGSLSAWREAVA